MRGDAPAKAVIAADGALDDAERLDLVPVVADLLVTKGAALADAGRSYEGLGLMNTGLALADANGLRTTALRALINIAATQTVLDPAAVIETCRQGVAEARRLSISSLVLAFLLNSIEAAFWTGDWDWAIAESDEVLGSELDPWDRASVLSLSVRIKGWRNELDAAAVTEFEQSYEGISDSAVQSGLHEGRSLLALSDGRFEEAYATALERARLSRVNAPFSYPVAARAALWLGDSGRARQALDALLETRAHGPAITYHRATIEAGVAALEGRTADALVGYRAAIAGWREARLPVLEALTAIDMATLLDRSDPAVQAAAEAARATLTRLRARPLLERLDAALAARPVSTAGGIGERSVASLPRA
jgi:hypothetical protein